MKLSLKDSEHLMSSSSAFSKACTLGQALLLKLVLKLVYWDKLLLMKPNLKDSEHLMYRSSVHVLMKPSLKDSEHYLANI